MVSGIMCQRISLIFWRHMVIAAAVPLKPVYLGICIVDSDRLLFRSLVHSRRAVPPPVGNSFSRPDIRVPDTVFRKTRAGTGGGRVWHAVGVLTCSAFSRHQIGDGE